MASMVLVQSQDAQFRHSKFCRLLNEAANGHIEALANATGIYPGQLRDYGNLHACITHQRRQPFATSDVILKGLMEVFGEQGRLAGIEMVEMLCNRLGGHYTPDASAEHAALYEEFAQAQQAVARAAVALTRYGFDADGVTARDAEQVRPLLHEAAVELAELDAAVAEAAAGR